MKTILFKLSLLFIFYACSNDDIFVTETNTKPISTSKNKILPLGASRVEGARPDYESYRYELWKILKQNNRTFDFIGTQSDESSYDNFENQSFDVDHEGRGGWTSGQIVAGLVDWLRETGSPDIVLFSSPGGNDILNQQPFEQTLSNINAIVDILQDNNPNVTIIIEQFAPMRSDEMTDEITLAFNSIRQQLVSIAEAHTTDTSKVITVNMYSGFNDTHLADTVHYNESGAAFIANRYYDVLDGILEP